MNEKISFSFETTLSGRYYLNMIKEAKEKGFNITLLFICLNGLDLAKQRVALRVSKGGHNIPIHTIEQRFKKGVKNFPLYAAEADEWYVYDNSGNGYILAAKSVSGQAEIINFDIYNKLVSE